MGTFSCMRTILLFLLCFFKIYSSNAQPKIGAIAPEIKLENAAGEAVSLSSLKGKVVLIDFWASWCGPCRKSNRAISPIYKKYRSKGFEVYAISLDHDTIAWQKAISTDRITWLQFNEQGNVANSTARAWNVEFLPTSFLLDKQGMIVSIDPASRELERYLYQALK